MVEEINEHTVAEVDRIEDAEYRCGFCGLTADSLEVFQENDCQL